MFIDSHCHLDFPELVKDIDQYLKNMQSLGVSQALCISVEMERFQGIKELIAMHPNLYGTVGVHPDYPDTREPSVDWLVTEAKNPKILGIGETGLDYFRIGDQSVDDYEWQRERFRTHIRAAKISKKPLVIHTRSSAVDTLRLMKEEGADEVGGVMHCFTESSDVAFEAMEMGFYISFSGIVTFKNAIEVQKTCQSIPLNRLLVETDSPYLAPVPYRGKTNQPAWVYFVGKYVAELRGITIEELGQITSTNFKNLFQPTRNT